MLGYKFIYPPMIVDLEANDRFFHETNQTLGDTLFPWFLLQSL